MIVKYFFYYNEWQLGEDWENTDHVFGALDSDSQVEQNEKAIAASLEISDDKQDIEEEDERLSLPPYRHIQNTSKSLEGKKSWQIKYL